MVESAAGHSTRCVKVRGKRGTALRECDDGAGARTPGASKSRCRNGVVLSAKRASRDYLRQSGGRALARDDALRQTLALATDRNRPKAEIPERPVYKPDNMLCSFQWSVFLKRRSEEKAMNVRAIGLTITVVVIAYVVVRLWKAFNSPDGERYLKRRMQGPFVPLTPEEKARDKARKLDS